jgi:hypothetical protein
MRCFNCDKIGHRKAECRLPSKPRGRGRVSSAITNSNSNFFRQ